jgi:hypothetical protein
MDYNLSFHHSYKQQLVGYQDIKLKVVVKILSNIFMCSFAKVFPLLQKLNFVHLWYLLSLPSKSKDIKRSFIIVSKVNYYDFEPYLHCKVKFFFVLQRISCDFNYL